MSWMQTYTGKALHFNNPTKKEICIEDIAHALSRICRFNGHTENHYSVAQHSVYVSQLVPPGDRLAALLHDATESYIGDMVSPLKKLIPDFSAYEDRLWAVIAGKYHIPKDLPASVKAADLVMLAVECRDLMNGDPVEWGIKPAPDNIPPIVCWDAETAKRHFMDRFNELTGEYGTALICASSMGGMP